MTFQEIVKELKSRTFRPVYLLMGEEPYYTDLITNYITDNILTPEEKSFNLSVFYGKDSTSETIINAARRYPMMAEHQIVVLKEAQVMKDIDKLDIYAKNPLKSTILVVCYKYKNYDKRKSLYKSIEKCNGIIFESARLYENKLPDWISAWLSSKQLTIRPDACQLMIEYLGTDLSKIANELEKLAIAMPVGESSITRTVIEKNIGISKEFNNFELQKSIATKNVLKANQIINYFSDNQKNNPITLTITSLFFFFSKLFTYHFIKDKSKGNVASVLKINPYFVSDYQMAAKNFDPRKTALVISWLRDYDLRSKGFGNSSTEPGELLKELLYKILH